jgi:large subunit ribosomal protein L4
MKTDLYNLSGEIVGQITLPKSIFEVKINEILISQAIRVALSNQRSAHAKTKHRGDVAGTTKKMYAQKGTGRARHSTAKAPQFVGGGSAHGPIGNQNFTLKLTKKMRQVALKSVLSKFAADKKIIVIDKISPIAPKTKEAVTFIDKIENSNKAIVSAKKIGIITATSQPNVKRAFSNIPGINLLSLSSLSTYNLSCQNFLIFSKKAITKLDK